MNRSPQPTSYLVPPSRTSACMLARMLIDITRTLGADTLDWPGDRPHAVRPSASVFAAGGPELELGAHSGTHVDAPAHFISNGATIDQVPAARFECPARVVEVRGMRLLPLEAIAELDIQAGEAVLFKTDNSELPRDRFREDYASLEPELAKELARLKVNLVGIDYLSVDPFDSRDYPAHHALLGAGVLLLEDCDLRAAVPGEYRLICLPLRIHGTDAAPCRALLLPR